MSSDPGSDSNIKRFLKVVGLPESFFDSSLIGKFQSVAGLIAIIIMAVIFSPVSHQDGTIIFLTQANITDILRQVSEIGIMALAMTFVIVTAGIDLSVGSVLALAATLVAKLLVGWSPDIPVWTHILMAIGLVLALTGMLGAVTGAIIAHLRIQPFIVTLAGMIGIRGLARWTTDNANIDIGFGEGAAPLFASIFSQKIVVIGSFLGLAVVCWLVFSYTVFGRYVRAIGDNERAAEYAGLPIKKIKIWVYTIIGVMTGLAGIIHAAQNHQGSPNDGVAYELEAIAAVVIGGTSLMGGKGSIWGTVIGTLILGVLTNIFRLRGVDINVEMMVKALIIIAAVWLQQRNFTKE